jgi:hypothetical protein
VHLARDPVATIPPDTPSKSAAPPARGLSKDERQRFEREAGEHVTQAMIAFATACAHHRESLKARAKADAELVSLVIDIAAGFAAPVFATWVVGKMAAKVQAATKAGTEIGSLTKLLNDRDQVKAAFTAATKVGQQAIKANSFALFGETEHDAFLQATQNAFHQCGQAITDHIGDMTDLELVTTWAAYAYEHTNIDVYKSAIGTLLGNYDKFVRDLGKHHYEVKNRGITEDEVDTENRVYMADLYGRPRAILVYTADTGWGPPQKSFRGYVPPEIEARAKKKTEQIFGKILTIDPAEIQGHIPPPPA